MTNLELIKELISMIEPKTDMDADIKKAAVALLAKETPTKAEPKPKATPSMGDEAKPKQKRKPFDNGKMKALLDGGWPVQKIADEMGCSEVTIYNHMKKEGLTT